jgi:hypothetical protein
MMRVKHDIAWAATWRILAHFNLRDEERHEAFPLVYECVKDALGLYDKEAKDLLHRLRPLSN